MCTHNQCFEQKNMKNNIFFHLKINIFTAVKYCCILHGRVCVMILSLIFQALSVTRSAVYDDFSGQFFHIVIFF